MNKQDFIDDIAHFEQKLHATGIRNSIVFFGSARVNSNFSQKHKLYYDQCRELAKAIAEHIISQTNAPSQWAIVTGGGPGIMEAANIGAHSAGLNSIGWSISIPYERKENAFISHEISHKFNYFSTRKLALLHNAKAVILFPGGIGTLDEFFELLVLIKTERMPPPCIILFDGIFWKSLINFDVMIDNGFIEKDIKEFFCYADNIGEAMQYIKEKLIVSA